MQVLFFCVQNIFPVFSKNAYSIVALLRFAYMPIECAPYTQLDTYYTTNSQGLICRFFKRFLYIVILKHLALPSTVMVHGDEGHVEKRPYCFQGPHSYPIAASPPCNSRHVFTTLSLPPFPDQNCPLQLSRSSLQIFLQGHHTDCILQDSFLIIFWKRSLIHQVHCFTMSRSLAWTQASEGSFHF